MIIREDLESYLNTLLKIHEFEDYGPNGLQILGKNEVKIIGFAVSATRESIEQAIEKKVDALIVHHGLFWKFHESKTITGPFYKRVAPLIKNDINLFAYHLPLDGHLELGNAALLAQNLNLKMIEPFSEYKKATIGIKGEFETAISPFELNQKLKSLLKKDIIYSKPVDFPEKLIKKIGIITGGANSKWIEAKKENLDAYITGEMSEHDYHDSSESNIFMFAGGHHATERFGVLALKNHLEKQYTNIKTYFFDSNNPA